MSVSSKSYQLVGELPSGGECLCPQATHVLFDLDGTISLMRAGWAELMLSIFLKIIPRLPDQSEEELRSMLLDDMMRQNGKPSVFQFTRFSERCIERGVSGIDPQQQNDAFVRQLQVIAARRRQAVLSGERAAETVLVPGIISFLEILKKRSLTLWLASGTDEKIVLPELEELGLNSYFGDRIFANRPGFSKLQIIEKILAQPGMSPEEFVAFGDGFIEINETARKGGLPVAVASDESWVDVPPYQSSARINPLKGSLLTQAGARLILPDYSEAQSIVNLIFGK